ncbi:hypothetical protein FM106_05580 [Brachybacterium faecium]|uniref:Phosphotransferase family protein n=1 Tax=Brachybacterium faecium (strain ATCC 43885 / DSM 4810 / JCM 11609 / LMG 19847 / NBRC 14762 / NCIMB 9860 / 6-10) TaxID=446465 RepID=C7ME71_BRAFD|nr:aminoglycoside phosphotransferase family protein [Brachybacterium faecium]ACU85878.1 phosphotransferase family protein [Brachybacterium faecium DSM 4810]SLM92881.1 hypothetical protein FM106_05580 [Brachybacterium faecium]HJG52111.1 aminoglycoside phosphotransferase family protein [Brachybacterium faecium]
MTNTRAGAPPGAVAALRERWPSLPWHGLRETHGAFHHVLLLPPVLALRLRTGAGHDAAVQREHEIAAALTAAGLPVPGPLLSPVHTADWSAAAVTFVDGEAREASDWSEDRAHVLPLLEAWAAAGHTHRQLGTRLPPARSWCGGARWPTLVDEMTAGHPSIREAARCRIADVLELEAAVEPSAVHGDLGPHNLLWDVSGRPTLIDTDHAAWADPAIDVAPLLAHHPRAELAADLPAAVLDRAAAHRRVLSLQVAAAAQLRGDHALRDHALRNFARRVRSGDPQW